MKKNKNAEYLLDYDIYKRLLKVRSDLQLTECSNPTEVRR